MEEEQSTKLKIRQATIKDVPLILTFIKELAEYEKLSSSVTANEALLKKTLFGKKKYAEVIIAEYEGEPAGHALYFYNYSTFAGKPGIYLEDIYIRPNLRGKGIGKSLLIHLINLAKEKDLGRVEWAVLDWNESAVNFYKRLGAVPMNGWTVFRLTEDKF